MAPTSLRSTAFDLELADVELALDAVRRVVGRVDPGRLSGEESLALADRLAEMERVVASGIARLTPRVLQTGSYAKAGHASGPDWLAAVAGSSATVAKGRLAAAERAAGLPELCGALQEGKLSAPQLDLVVRTAGVAPGAVETLLELVAERASHQELCAEATRLRTCARSQETERARRARIHAGRHFRWHQDPDGGVRGEFSCDEVQWARISPTLEAQTKARWKAAGSASGDTYEAHRLDALIDLLCGPPDARKDARPQVLVLIDAEALRRGTTTTGEVCEIEGIGPIPVEAAVDLLGAGSLKFLVKEGKDIRTVTRSTRDLAQKTAAALLARDRVCVVPGCGKRLGLEGDHCEVDYSDDGPTTLSNLARLCGPHHAMKTYGKWKLTGGPGNWKWITPPKPPSAGAIARARRVATAKADRNRLRRT